MAVIFAVTSYKELDLALRELAFPSLRGRRADRADQSIDELNHDTLTLAVDLTGR